MKNAKTITLSLLALATIALPVAAGGSEKVADGTLLYHYDSGIQWNGKWATSSLSGDTYEKKTTACVGECSTSGWVAKDEQTAYVKDLGGYTDTAYTSYNYR